MSWKSHFIVTQGSVCVSVYKMKRDQESVCWTQCVCPLEGWGKGWKEEVIFDF